MPPSGRYHKQDAYLIALDPCFSNREFKVGETGVTVGRDATQCEITASKPTISRRHFSIKYIKDSGKFQLVDLHSTNGTFINGKKVNEAFLSDGDFIGLGSETAKHLRFQSTSNRNFSWSETLLPKQAWTIGRLQDNDISLPFEPTVSAHHARIVNSSGSLYVTDEKSLNGTWLNGQRVKKARLNQADTLVIGSTYFHFTLNADGSLTLLRRECGDDVKVECVGVNRDVKIGSGKTLRLLNNITLTLEPGEFVGILGPSGSGKTTLLKALNGYTPPSHGCVFLNETPLYRAYDMFRDTIGYVPQDDIIHTDLSVKKCLDYVARLRLPADFKSEQRTDIVESTIEAIGLSHVCDNKVKELSGGQRKRVSIGAELITRPSVLFLDEPTSGLDPCVEEKLMRHFNNMAHKGTTILITTHILYSLSMLDRIIILSRGRLVFFGTPSEAMVFFGSEGNPIERPTRIFDLLEGEAANILPELLSASGDIRTSIAEYYEMRYRESEFWQKNIGDKFSSLSKDIYKNIEETDKTITRNKELPHYSDLLKPASSSKLWDMNFKELASFRLWKTLSQRQLELRFTSWKRAFIYALIPFILALVTLSQNMNGFTQDQVAAQQRQQITEKIFRGGPMVDQYLKVLLSPEGLNDPRSAADIVYALHHEGPANLPIPLSVLLMFIMTSVFMGTIIACLEISPEKAIYQRERMSNLKIIDYLGSKLPFCLSVTAVQCLLFIAVCYLNSSIREVSLIPVWITMTAVAWASVSLGLFISASDPTPGRFSVILAIIAVLPQLILSGGLGPDFFKGMGIVTQYISDILPARWGIEMLLTAVYDDIPIKSINWIPDFVRNIMGFQFGTKAFYYDLSFLAILSFAYLLITMVILKRRDSV